MAVKIKLKRLGKMRNPQYRIVVADARTKRDGRAIEEIGKYHPKEDPSFIEVDSERAQYWLSVGAQPTEPVAAILKVTGDWQKFKGLPGPGGHPAGRRAQGRARRPSSRRPPRRLRRRSQGPGHHAEEEGRQGSSARRRGRGRRGWSRPLEADAAVSRPSRSSRPPEGDTVVIDEVVEVVETADGETVVVDDVVEVVENAEGEVIEVTARG